MKKPSGELRGFVVDLTLQNVSNMLLNITCSNTSDVSIGVP